MQNISFIKKAKFGDMNKKNKGKDIYIPIGEKEISFRPESKKSIDIELLLLNILLFSLIAIFSLGYINWPLFLFLFYAFAMRVFIGNHDRIHASKKNKFSRFVEVFAEGIAVVVTPWDEPYDSFKKKHLTHHAKHAQNNSSKLDTKNNPHSVFELGGFFRVFFSCFFYEEVQLFLDIQNNNLTKSRLYRFLMYVPLQIAFIFAFGWDKFLVVFFAMCLVGFSAWFVFSWLIHQPAIYKFGFAKQVPKFFKQMFALIHGQRVTEGCIHHATHHAWPGIPYNQLNKFDSIAVQNTNSQGFYSKPKLN